MKDPVNLITASAILWSLLVIIIGWAIVFAFEGWRIRDMEKKSSKPKKYPKEVDRLLELDEFEKKIS